MSRENVEAVKRGFDAFNRADIEALLGELDPEVEWHPVLQVVMLGGGEPSVHRGHEGVRDALRAWYEVLAEIQVTVSETRDLGERIVAIGRIRARGKEGGAPVESPAAWVFEFKNGKAVRAREYLDPKEALEAAGLSE
jgi:ketosteroid isomerase-like protein